MYIYVYIYIYMSSNGTNELVMVKKTALDNLIKKNKELEDKGIRKTTESKVLKKKLNILMNEIKKSNKTIINNYFSETDSKSEPSDIKYLSESIVDTDTGTDILSGKPETDDRTEQSISIDYLTDLLDNELCTATDIKQSGPLQSKSLGQFKRERTGEEVVMLDDPIADAIRWLDERQ
jgi:hypothetical protein